MRKRVIAAVQQNTSPSERRSSSENDDSERIGSRGEPTRPVALLDVRRLLQPVAGCCRAGLPGVPALNGCTRRLAPMVRAAPK